MPTFLATSQPFLYCGTNQTTLSVTWTATAASTTIAWYDAPPYGIAPVGLTGSGGYVVCNAAVTQPGAPQTAEQRLQRDRRIMRDQIMRKRAHRRGRKLLISMLTDAQAMEYAKSGAFTTVGSKGGIFRLRKVGRVQELDLHRNVIALHCIHTSWGFIEEDNLITLKLLCETDEMQFRKTANISRLATPQPLELAA